MRIFEKPPKYPLLVTLVLALASASPTLARAAVPPDRVINTVELAPYGEPEDSLVVSSTGVTAVRFDMPFIAAYRVTKIRFASATIGGVPAIFPRVSLIKASRFARAPHEADWSAPVFQASPYVGSPNGMNEIATDIAVSDSGVTFYLCLEFPTEGTVPPDEYPYLRADLRDMETGFFQCAYELDAQHVVSWVRNYNVVAGLVCEVSAAPPPVPQDLALNRRVGIAEFTYRIPQRDRHRVDHVDLLAHLSYGPWRVVGSSSPGSPARVQASEDLLNVGLTFAVQSVDKDGNRSAVSDVLRSERGPYDRFEPNGSIDEATPAPSGPNLGGATIFAAGDLDFYQVWASPGDVISATAFASWPLSDGLNDLDLVAYLYDDHGHVVASDDGSRDGLNPSIRYRVRQPLTKADRNPMRFTVLFRDRRGSSFAPDAAPIVLNPFEQIYNFAIETTSDPTGRAAALQPRILGTTANADGISLRYSVPAGTESAPLAIRLFDVRGRLVRTILDSPGAAQRSVTWDRRNASGRIVSSGVYYAVVEVEGSRVVRKLVVAK
jgi:hypothetical protein